MSVNNLKNPTECQLDNLFLDTETVGFHGLIVLIQYAINEGEIVLYNVWKEPIWKTLELLESFCEYNVVGFNLAFDWFHVVKLYTTLSLCPDYDWIPQEHIDEIAVYEERARAEGLCIKPKSACDLMLWSRKGPYQSLMERHPVRVRRIPKRIASLVQGELEERIKIPAIYTDRRADKLAPTWQIVDNKNKDTGEIDTEFVDIKLSFAPDGRLKALAKHVLGAKDAVMFEAAEPDTKWRPNEEGYAPFALALGKPGKWNWTWPETIHAHISHWAFNRIGIKYATDDIVYTRGLYNHFKETVTEFHSNDDDSVLACQVAAVRWRGFAFDINRVKEQRAKAEAKLKNIPIDKKACIRWFAEVTEPDRMIVFKVDGTGDVVLEKVGGKQDEETGTWSEYWTNEDGSEHPVVQRVRMVRDARKAKKEIELYDKILLAGRFHASFIVIGTLSSRMSGTDGLNPQGIISSTQVRNCFTLADDGYVLSGGDYDAFEVCISEAVYDDAKLREDILSGKKIHALFAEGLFPDQTYDSIMESKGSKVKDFYTEGKRGVFAMNYGGNENTLMKKLGVSEEVATQAFVDFGKRYPGVAKARQRIIDMFCSMRQPGGIGTRVEWHEPAEKIESLLGFARYFTLENRICKSLFTLSNKVPESWKYVRVKVVRRDREQTASGASQSALYAAAFGLQGANMRAAANHVIQSTGATITKRTQRRIWDIQPSGVHRWLVAPLNVHDEVMVVHDPELREQIAANVEETVQSYKELIPLIQMDWARDLACWKDGEFVCDTCRRRYGVGKQKEHLVHKKKWTGNCNECRTNISEISS